MPGTVARWALSSFLGSLPAQASEELLGLGVTRQFESGRRLLREGDAGTHIELLVSGYVKVTAALGGVETLLAIRVPGDILGEIGAVTGRPRSATVTACGWVTASVVSRDEFRRFLRRYPDAALHMAATMGERLRWADQRRNAPTAYRAEVRVARLLFEIAITCGYRTGEGVTLGVTLSQPELASMVGIAEPTAQKAIRELRNSGVVRTGYRRITVVDLDALRRAGAGADACPSEPGARMPYQ